MSLPLQASVENTVQEVEKHWLSVKENVACTAVNKEGYAVTVFWDMKGSIAINFLEKCASAKQCFLWKTS